MLLYNTFLVIGFTKTYTNHSVFTKWVNKNTIPIFIIVYIDDILTLSPSNKVIKAFENQLIKHFILIDKGPIKEYLAIEIIRQESSIALL